MKGFQHKAYLISKRFDLGLQANGLTGFILNRAMTSRDCLPAPSVPTIAAVTKQKKKTKTIFSLVLS